MTKKILSAVFVLAMASLVPGAAWAQTMWTESADKSMVAKPPGTPDAPKPAKDEAKGDKKDKKAEVSNPLQLADDAPTVYTVVKGDTLWDISAKFLKQPWRWPEIWNMNREQIKDPHWIYPGDVIKLSFDSQGRPMLSFLSRGEAAGIAGGTVHVDPRIRIESIGLAIPSIPLRVIGPFLSLPLVVESGALKNAPKFIGTEEERVVFGAGDVVYGVGLDPAQGTKWQAYRPGRELIDPDTKESLGFEAIYLGDASVTKFGEASRMEVTKANQEINRGDRLVPRAEALISSYSPHSPDREVKGKIIANAAGLTDSAQYSVVILNVGKREGVEPGVVLATYHAGATVSTRDPDQVGGSSIINKISQALGGGEKDPYPAEVKLPDERNGLVFVFRSFEKVSYALVLNSRLAIQLGDTVKNP